MIAFPPRRGAKLREIEMGQEMQVSDHKHEPSFRHVMSSHAGINLGTCNCGAATRTYEVQGRRITIERSADQTIDLFERARSIGYDDAAAARLADCWVNYNMISDPCMIHPNHSVTTDHQGFAVDGCQACAVLVLTHDKGWTMAGWEAEQAARQAEAERLVAEGVMAEAELDDRDAMTGVDMIKELVTLAPVGKVAPVHLLVSLGRTASGRLVGPRMQATTDTAKVTCKCCPKTRKFQSEAYRQARDAARDAWAKAGLAVGMVVRNLATGHLGIINELDVSIRVGYWTGPQTGSTYARLVDFDSACEIITARDLGVRAGVTLVSNLGGTCVVDEVGAVGVFATPEGDTAARMWTLSQLAAEISRGWLAVVPEAPTALYVRPDGTRQAVTMADMAQVGMRVSYGYGSANNGDVVAVSWHAATVKRADGTQYLLTLVELVRELNRANVSTYMPDANGRPIGSWR